MTEMSMGDLLSQEPGSAARACAGKTEWSYMPLNQISLMMIKLLPEKDPPSLSDLTYVLAQFQQQGGQIEAVNVLEMGFRYFMHVTGLDFHHACRRVINVWRIGEEKYAKFNWMKGMRWSQPIESAQRHVMWMWEGEEVDPESDEHHAAHFICNAMMLVHFVVYYPEGNDLPCEWYK